MLNADDPVIVEDLHRISVYLGSYRATLVERISRASGTGLLDDGVEITTTFDIDNAVGIASENEGSLDIRASLGSRINCSGILGIDNRVSGKRSCCAQGNRLRCRSVGPGRSKGVLGTSDLDLVSTFGEIRNLFIGRSVLQDERRRGGSIRIDGIQHALLVNFRLRAFDKDNTEHSADFAGVDLLFVRVLGYVLPELIGLEIERRIGRDNRNVMIATALTIEHLGFLLLQGTHSLADIRDGQLVSSLNRLPGNIRSVVLDVRAGVHFVSGNPLDCRADLFAQHIGSTFHDIIIGSSLEQIRNLNIRTVLLHSCGHVRLGEALSVRSYTFGKAGGNKFRIEQSPTSKLYSFAVVPGDVALLTILGMDQLRLCVFVKEWGA